MNQFYEEIIESINATIEEHKTKRSDNPFCTISDPANQKLSFNEQFREHFSENKSVKSQ